jgi:hypothetical protein
VRCLTAAEAVPEQAGFSGDTMPDDTMPEHTMPEHTMPEHTMPEHTVPEQIVPDDTMPEARGPGLSCHVRRREFAGCEGLAEQRGPFSVDCYFARGRLVSPAPSSSG